MELVIKDNASIFDSEAGALVNPINCVGVMGGGLAAAFKQRYPLMFSDYREDCRHAKISVGKMWLWLDTDGPTADAPHLVINFPTKDDWKNPSRIEYITAGLDDLHELLTTKLSHLEAVAIPALGCGLGGLRWEDVKPLIVDRLSDLDIRLELYPPRG